MNDIKFANMIYNKSLDIINIIDTDLYMPSNEENLLQYTLKLLNKSFFFQFFKSQINPYIKNSKIRELLINIGCQTLYFLCTCSSFNEFCFQNNIRYSKNQHTVLRECFYKTSLILPLSQGFYLTKGVDI